MSPDEVGSGRVDEPNAADAAGQAVFLRVLVDDVRDFKDGRAAVVLRTSADAVAYVQGLHGRWVDELWLDHDLVGEDTVQPLVDLLVADAAHGRPLRVGRIWVHSSNIREATASCRSSQRRATQCSVPLPRTSGGTPVSIGGRGQPPPPTASHQRQDADRRTRCPVVPERMPRAEDEPATEARLAPARGPPDAEVAEDVRGCPREAERPPRDSLLVLRLEAPVEDRPADHPRQLHHDAERWSATVSGSRALDLEATVGRRSNTSMTSCSIALSGVGARLQALRVAGRLTAGGARAARGRGRGRHP